MLEISITNEQKIEVILAPVSESGAPAKLDGVPVWNVVNGEATVEAAEDGLSAFLVSGDSPGASEILVEADADLGAGIVTISETIKLTVEGAQAKSLNATVGTAVPK